MPKKTLPALLPPPSSSLLEFSQAREELTHRFLANSYRRNSLNLAAAIGILGHHVIDSFQTQINYYSGLQDYQPKWLNQIKQNVIDTALGMYADIAGEAQLATISAKLDQIIEENFKSNNQFAKSRQTDFETIAKQLQDLRIESSLTVEQLAEKVGLAPRSVYRHLSGEAIPNRRHVAIYEKAMSNALHKEVRIKTSPKVSKRQSKRQ